MIKWFIKIQELIQAFFGVLKIIISSNIFINVKKFRSGQFDKVLIVGNGPSLKETLSTNLDFFYNKDLVCVNYFCFSPEFARLKPAYYVIAAPEYWMEIPPTKFHETMRDKFFEILAKEVDWDMKLFAPIAAKKSKVWKAIFKKNLKVKMCYYNNTGVEGSQLFLNWVMKHDLGMPRLHNVLTPSIYIALNLNYKEIFLVGADHSWHEEVKIDLENNFTINHEHFYDNSNQEGAMHKLNGDKYCFHDFLRKIYLAFVSYHLLSHYASTLDATIYNASKKSYIDAFPKIKI
jgi:hypothetical protein